MNLNNLFEKIENTSNDIPIVLVDKSGSTQSLMSTGKSIMITFADIISKHIKSKYRLMFWCDKYEIIDDIVYLDETKEIIDDIIPAGMTDMSMAFEFIPVEWLSACHNIYILTDGDINEDKYNFALQIKTLTELNPNIKLHIISLEANNHDYQNKEYYAGI